MNDSMRWKSLATVVLGAVVGGVIGHYATWWLALQGYYALVLPGAVLGLGAGLRVRDRSVLRGVLCGVAAVALGLFTDWRVEPFIADKSLGYYLEHLHLLRPFTMLMVALGGACGYWLAAGKEQLRPAASPDPRGPGTA